MLARRYTQPVHFLLTNRAIFFSGSDEAGITRSGARFLFDPTRLADIFKILCGQARPFHQFRHAVGLVQDEAFCQPCNSSEEIVSGLRGQVVAKTRDPADQVVAQESALQTLGLERSGAVIFGPACMFFRA